MPTTETLVIGEDVQAWSPDLDAIAALATALFGRSLLTLADDAALRTSAGLGTVATLASDTDTALAANSDSRVATQKAVKAYVDAAVTGLLDFKGSTNASGNPNYPAGSKGDAYVISAAGKIGGASGKSVDVGDVYVASADNAGGTEASVGTSWFVLEHNLAGALLAANDLSDLASAPAARANLGLGSAAETTYDIGTWAPAYSPAAGAFGAITYGAQIGTYTKVGRLMFVTGSIYTTALTVGTASGALSVSGLPVAGSASGLSVSDLRLWGSNAPGWTEVSGSSVLLKNRATLGGDLVATLVSDMSAAAVANILSFSGCYPT